MTETAIDVSLVDLTTSVEVTDLAIDVEITEPTIQVTHDEVAVEVQYAGATGPRGPGGASTLTLTAAQALGGHRLVYSSAPGACDYATNAVFGQRFALLGLTLGAAASGASVEVLSYGPITEGSWSWTPGGALYLGTNGLLTQTPPVAPATFLVVVGYAIDATRILLDLHDPIAIN